MSPHEARITEERDGSFFTLIVRIDRDGSENVIPTYKSRWFKTRKAAEKSTSDYINKMIARNNLTGASQGGSQT